MAGRLRFWLNKKPIASFCRYLKLTRQLDAMADLSFHDRHWQLVSDTPKPATSRWVPAQKPRIAIVCDPLNHAYFSAAAQLFPLPSDPEAARDIFEQNAPQLLLVVSPWTGLVGEWKHLTTRPDRTAALVAIVAIAREKGIPTAFLSHEDPPHFDEFLPLARQFDTILTTAQECIEDYRKILGHDRVFLLPFGVNPLVHNPLGITQTPAIDEVLFAGSYMGMFPERCADFHALAAAAGERLRIIDRQYTYPRRGNPLRHYRGAALFFSPEFSPRVAPKLGSGDLSLLQRHFAATINLNTVTDSQTMYSRRVPESLAMGNLVLSNASPGMVNRYPEVVVDDVAAAVARGPVWQSRLSGIRRVLACDTVFHRMAVLCAACGLDYPALPTRVVAVVPEGVDLDNQTLAPAAIVAPGQPIPSCDAVWHPAPGPIAPTALQDAMAAFCYADIDFARPAAPGETPFVLTEAFEPAGAIVWAGRPTARGLTLPAN